MALKKKPVTGMKDILPGEMEIRDYVLNIIKDTYRGYGFSAIETPCVEHIENLFSKQGGDNEKLIFKILKRGENLKLDQSKEEADQILQHLIRANDVWGISEEGELYLILSQTDKESLPIVSGRLKKAGIITYETGIAQIARGGGEV